jgi:hypothetical protein
MTYTSSDSQKSKDSQAQRGTVRCWRCGVSGAVVDAGPALGVMMGADGDVPGSADFAPGDKYPMQRGAVRSGRSGASEAVVGVGPALGVTIRTDGGDPASVAFARGDKFPMLSLPPGACPGRGAVRFGVSEIVVGARPAPGMTQGEHGGDCASVDFARGGKYPMQRACESIGFADVSRNKHKLFQ